MRWPTTGEYATEPTRHADVSHLDQDFGRPSPENSRDRVRWGPVWAGVLAVLTTFIVLQLLFFALACGAAPTDYCAACWCGRAPA